MATMTNNLEDHFIQDLKNLVSLDYAAIEGYEAALKGIKNKEYKNILEGFKNDHERHIRNISHFLKMKGYNCPSGPGMKKLLTQGKVILATFAGDIAILKATMGNEIITTEAYEKINAYIDIPSDIKKALLEGHEDEKKHLLWIEDELDAIS